jgi:hypothetical protein
VGESEQWGERVTPQRNGAFSPKSGLDFSNTYEHRESLPKPSHREKLVTAGLQVVFEQGYCGASVRDIVQAAGVPQGSVVYCLKAAVSAGDLSSTTDRDLLAHFLYASLQGAILESKVERSSAPLKRFKKVALSTLLR